jgi:hypothetical protein
VGVGLTVGAAVVEVQPLTIINTAEAPPIPFMAADLKIARFRAICHGLVVYCEG